MIDALLDTLGPAGTLVVPTFTFAHGSKANPVFNMARDPSEMSQITEATRRRPAARRGVAICCTPSRPLVNTPSNLPPTTDHQTGR